MKITFDTLEKMTDPNKKAQVLFAIRTIKDRKAVGLAEPPIEIIKLIDENQI